MRDGSLLAYRSLSEAADHYATQFILVTVDPSSGVMRTLAQLPGIRLPP